MTLTQRTRSSTWALSTPHRSLSSPPKNKRVLAGVALLYVAYIPFDILPVAYGRTLTGPLAVLLIVTWIISSLRHHEKISFPRNAGILLFLYCFWMICTIFWSVDTTAATGSVQPFLLQAPLVVILSNTLGNMWLRSLVTLGCSTSVLGLVVLTSSADALREGRANVGGVDENITAMVLAVGFAALVYAVTHLGRRAALFVPPAVVTGAAALHTGSRSGAIAVVGVLVIALMPLIRQGRRRPVVWFRAAGVVLLAYFSFTIARDAGLLPQRVMDLLNQGPAYADSGRASIIDAYLRTFGHWAFFGVGVGNDATYLSATEGAYHNAHSLFWHTWIVTGLVGLTLFASFLTVVIRRGLRSPASQALIPLFVPIVVFAITLGGDETSVFWFVVALALIPGAPEPRSSEKARRQARVLFHSQAGEQRGSVTT